MVLHPSITSTMPRSALALASLFFLSLHLIKFTATAPLKPRSICIPQFALANQACSIIPIEPKEEATHVSLLADDAGPGNGTGTAGGGGDDSNSTYITDDDDDSGDDDNDDDVDDDDSGREGNSHHGRHGHKHHGHGDHGHKHHDHKRKHHDHKRKHHDHGRGRHGHRDHREPRANKDCCRWLKEVDPACVCESLLQLPKFLIKPMHSYYISVGDSCDFTFRCIGV